MKRLTRLALLAVVLLAGLGGLTLHALRTIPTAHATSCVRTMWAATTTSTTLTSNPGNGYGIYSVEVSVQIEVDAVTSVYCGYVRGEFIWTATSSGSTAYIADALCINTSDTTNAGCTSEPYINGTTLAENDYQLALGASGVSAPQYSPTFQDTTCPGDISAGGYLFGYGGIFGSSAGTPGTWYPGGSSYATTCGVKS